MYSVRLFKLNSEAEWKERKCLLLKWNNQGHGECNLDQLERKKEEEWWHPGAKNCMFKSIWIWIVFFQLVGAAFGAAGQRCMALSTAVFVGESKEWIPELIEKAKKLKVNAGTLEL